MKRVPSTARRGFAGLLFVSMLGIGVVKAQGCQRPVDDTPASEPATEPRSVTATPETASQTAGVADVGSAEATSTDVGAPDATDPPAAVETRPMMPATKSGMPMKLPPVQKQQAE